MKVYIKGQLRPENLPVCPRWEHARGNCISLLSFTWPESCTSTCPAITCCCKCRQSLWAAWTYGMALWTRRAKLGTSWGTSPLPGSGLKAEQAFLLACLGFACCVQQQLSASSLAVQQPDVSVWWGNRKWVQTTGLFAFLFIHAGQWDHVAENLLVLLSMCSNTPPISSIKDLCRH